MCVCLSIKLGGGSIRPAAIFRLRQSHLPRIACVFLKRLKAGGPFYLVSRPGTGEVKDPTQGSGLIILEDNSCN